jgi:hypothetical protein
MAARVAGATVRPHAATRGAPGSDAVRRTQAGLRARQLKLEAVQAFPLA